MLNNNDDDYLTSIAMAMFLNDRINRKIRSMESKGGVLNGEFIKKHLERETELEEKIFELEERIKNISSKKSEGDINPETYYSKDSIYYTILQGMIPRMSISYDNSEGFMLSVDNCYIDGHLAKYLESLKREYSEQIEKTLWGMPILNNSKSPYVLNIDYGNESDLTTKVTAAIPEKWGNNLTDVIDTCGIGGYPK